MTLSAICDGISVLKGETCRRFELPAIYFVKGKYGAIVDTGPASMAPSIVQAVKELGWEKDEVRYLIPTHIHLDHGGGAGYLSHEFPSAKVVGWCGAAQHLIDPAALIDATRKIFGPDFEEEFGEILPVARERVLAVSEGDRIDLVGRELEVYYTPGHASHHISLLDIPTKALLCGEALGHYLPTVDAVRPTVALPMLDLDASFRTIDKLSQLSASVILFAEWGISWDAARMFRLARKAFEDYSNIVLEGLRQKLSTDDIVSRLIDFEKAQWPCFAELPRHWMHEHASIAKGLSSYFRKKGLV